MWHVTCDMWQVTPDTWHVTCDMWHATRDMWHVTLRAPYPPEAPRGWHRGCEEDHSNERKGLLHRGQTYKRTDGHRDSMTESAQWANSVKMWQYVEINLWRNFLSWAAFLNELNFVCVSKLTERFNLKVIVRKNQFVNIFQRKWRADVSTFPSAGPECLPGGACGGAVGSVPLHQYSGSVYRRL